MNKIDQMVKRLLLAYPTLYTNRFDAMATILTTSTYEWRNGEIIELEGYQPEAATPESMVAQFEKRLAERKTEYDPAHNHECLSKLHRKIITDAERELHDARFIAANIDTYSTSYAGCDYPVLHLWLHHTHRYNVSDLWTVNNKPEVIDEEWREAIYQWIHLMMPSVNSLFGMFQERNERPVSKMKGKGFAPVPGYEEVFNWAYTTWQAYQGPLNAKVAKAMHESIEKILAETEE